MNNKEIAEILEEDEEDALRYLNKLEVEEFEDIKSGYRINFHFDKNPYFENDVLTKEFHLGSSASQSTPICWKEGSDLTKKAKTKAPMKGRKRPLKHRSFFDWFTDHGDPSSDEIAELIKDDMWPNPLQYYLAPDIDVENGIEGDGEECESEEEEDEEDGADDGDEGGEGEEGDDSVVVVEEDVDEDDDEEEEAVNDEDDGVNEEDDLVDEIEHDDGEEPE